MSVAYLDHAATSPIRPRARQAVEGIWDQLLGNPTGGHTLARKARSYLEQAREVVADFLGASASEIVFTSSGTESDNLAIKGSLQAHEQKRVLVSAIEHRAVLNTAKKSCARLGLNLELIPVDSNAVVDLNWLEEALDDDVALVSVMTVNNEVGTIEPIEMISEIVRTKAPNALLHTDAVQAACWLDLKPIWQCVDLLSLGAHKFGGPVGVGALAIKEGVKILPLLDGGSQERGIRAGTQNVAGAVGMAEALKDLTQEFDLYIQKIKHLRDQLIDSIIRDLHNVTETVKRGLKIAGNCHVLIDGVEPDQLLWMLDEKGVCVSTGSSCASGALEPSHVLEAIGTNPRRDLCALRMTLGWSSTEQEIQYGAKSVVESVRQLLSDCT